MAQHGDTTPLLSAGGRANAAILLTLESEPVGAHPVCDFDENGVWISCSWNARYASPDLSREVRDGADWLVWC